MTVHTKSEYRELLIGCGHARDKRINVPGTGLDWRGLVTLDKNPYCYPDYLCDLNSIPWVTWEEGIDKDIPEFDEIHAYEVLEHLGQQGDAESFFATFSEIWRILKPCGYLCATVPSRFSPWLWGDPSHRRAILPESLVFLDQTEYIRQLDGEHKTPMSDFRSIYKSDFRCIQRADNRETFAFILQAVKPARISL